MAQLIPNYEQLSPLAEKLRNGKYRDIKCTAVLLDVHDHVISETRSTKIRIHKQDVLNADVLLQQDFILPIYEAAHTSRISIRNDKGIEVGYFPFRRKVKKNETIESHKH